MKPSTAHRRPLAVALAALALAATACTTDTGSPQTAEDRERASAEKKEYFDEECADTVIPELPDLTPIEGEGDGTAPVETPFGEVDLPTNPQRALGMYTTDVDILIWLGYPLADQQPVRGDAGYTTFACFFPYEPLDGVTTFGNYPDYDYEGILAAEPDFILNGLGYDKKVNRRLPEIAPTYSVDAFDGRSWMEHFEETARALGREDRFEMWKDIYDERVAEVAEAIGDTAGITAAPLGYYDGKATSACYTGVECQVFEDLGLDVPELAKTADGTGTSLSAEQLGQLEEIDYAFVIKNIGDDGQREYDSMLEELEKNPLWNELPFVQDGQIVNYELEMTFGSPSGQLAFLDVVEGALAK